MASNSEERKDAGLSATMLLDCPRRIALATEHDYYEYPSRYWQRFRGTIGHYMMEAYDEEDDSIIKEERFKKTINIDGVDVEITGKPDKILTLRQLIIDYKTIRSVPKTAKPSHEQQVNIYRWLLWGGTRVHGDQEPVYITITKGGIQYFDMDMPLKVPVPIWELEQTEEFIRQKVRPIIAWKETKELPPLWFNEKGTDRHPLCDPKWCALREICDARYDSDARGK